MPPAFASPGLPAAVQSLIGAEEALIAVETDLTSLGGLGVAWMVVCAETIYRLEQTPNGLEVIGAHRIEELSHPVTEDLVDALAISVKSRQGTIELIRGTTSKRTILVAAQEQLKSFCAGKGVPEIEINLRVCERCSRPLPKDSDICPACLNRGKTLLRLFEFTKPYKGRLVWGTSLIVTGVAIALLPPYFTKRLVDDVLSQGQTQFFGPLILAMLVSNSC